MTLHERAIEGARVRFKRVGLPYREVVYEDLVRDESRVSPRSSGSSASSRSPVSSSLQKVNPTAHEELIENYGEVRDALEGTKFAGQLR